MGIATARVMSAQVRGCEAIPVTVEARIEDCGIPSMEIAGMPDSAVLESRSRVRHAIRASGFTLPRNKVVVRLLPDGLRKVGSSHDLAIAVAILVASGQLPAAVAEGRLLYGELCLNGDVLTCRGTICAQECAMREGLVPVFSPDAETVDAYAPALELSNLSELADGGLREHVDAKSEMGDCPRHLSEVDGHEEAKRKIVAATQARRSMVLVGKDEGLLRALAECVPSVLEDDPEAQRKTELVRSAAGLGMGKYRRPVRYVSPSISSGALVGGGRPVIPGEVSLANGGALVLEDVFQMSERQLATLAHISDEGVSRLVRVDGCYSFPARFVMVGLCTADPEKREGRAVTATLERYFDTVIPVTSE